MADQDVIARFEEVRENVARAAHDCGREPGKVTLVAVSKTFPAEAIVPVLEAGHRVFGEKLRSGNRRQMAGPA